MLRPAQLLGFVLFLGSAATAQTHPTSVWTASELSALQANATQPGWAALWSGRNWSNLSGGANILHFMSRFATADSIRTTAASGEYQPALQAGGYAMLAKLTNQSVNVATDLLLSMCATPGVTPPANASAFPAFNWSADPYGSPPADDCDMEQAAAVRSLAIALDVLFDQLTQAQQDSCLKALQYYTDSLARVADTANTTQRTPNCEPFTGWWQGDLGNNHSWNNNAAIGLAGQVLEGTTRLSAPDVNGVSRTYDYLAVNYYEPVAAANLARIRAMQDLVSDGAWHEGIGYLVTGMEPLVSYWIGASRRGGANWAADQSALLHGFGTYFYYLQHPDHPQVSTMTNADYNWIRPYILPVLRWAARRYQNAAGSPAVTTDTQAASFAQAAADRFLDDQRTDWPVRLEFALAYALEYVAYSNAPAAVTPGTARDLWNSDQQSFVTGPGFDGFIVAFKSGVFGGKGMRQKCIDLAATCTTAACAAALPDLNFSHDHEDDLGLWIYGGAASQSTSNRAPFSAGWSLPEGTGYNCCDVPGGQADGGVPNDHEHSTEWHNTVLIDGLGQRGDDKVTQKHNAVNCYGAQPTWFLNRVASMPVAASMADYTLARGDGTQLYEGVSALSRTVIVNREGYVIVRDLVQENRTTGQGTLTQLYHSLNPAGTVRLTDGIGVLLDNSLPNPAADDAVPSTTSMTVRVVAPASPTIDISQQADDAHQLYYLTPWVGSFAEFFSPDGNYGKVKISGPVAAPSYTSSVISVLQPRNSQGPTLETGPQAERAVGPLASSTPEAGAIVGNDFWIFNKRGSASNSASGITIAGGTNGFDVGMVSYAGEHEPLSLVLHADAANATLSDVFGQGGASRTLLRSPAAGQTIEVTTDQNDVAQISGTSNGRGALSLVGLSFLAYRATSVVASGQQLGFNESSGTITVTSMAAPTPPAISGITFDRLSNTSVKISWSTNALADTQVRYTSSAGGMHTGTGIYTYTPKTDTSGGTSSHVVQIDGLAPEFEYEFWARSATSSGIAFAFAGIADVWVNAGVPAAQNWHVAAGNASTAEFVSAVATDSAGNTYVAGRTSGVMGTNVTSNAGGTDGFIRKLDSTGATVWTRQYATARDDEVVSLAVDGSTLYALTGTTAFAFTNAPVVLKYGLDGTLLATLPVGSPALTSARALALGPVSHDLYVLGSALVRMTASGTQVWQQTLPNTAFGIAAGSGEQSIYVAASSCAYCTGQVAPGALLSSYSAANGAANWTADAINSPTSIIDATHCVASMSMAVGADATGVYLTGWCADSWIYGNDSDVNPNSRRVFLARYAPPQTAPVFLKKSGLQDGVTFANAIAVAPSGIYVGGSTDAAYFGPVTPPSGLMQFTSGDGFFAKFTSDGALAWGTQIGTGLEDEVFAVAVDASGNAVFGGWTGGNNLDPSNADGFVRQYAPQTTPTTVPPAGVRTHWIAASTHVELAAAPQIDTSRWFISTGTDGTASVTQSGGSINISPAPNNGQSQGLVQSLGTFELTNSSASVQVRSVVNGSGHVNAVMHLQVDWNNQLNWWYEAGNLYANYYINGVQFPLATLTYNSIAHAWWRIRESDGTTFWETSPNGVEWTVQAQIATSSLFSVKALSYVLGAREFSTGNPAPGTASYAQINRPY